MKGWAPRLICLHFSHSLLSPISGQTRWTRTIRKSRSARNSSKCIWITLIYLFNATNHTESRMDLQVAFLKFTKQPKARKTKAFVEAMICPSVVEDPQWVVMSFFSWARWQKRKEGCQMTSDCQVISERREPVRVGQLLLQGHAVHWQIPTQMDALIWGGRMQNKQIRIRI